MNGILVIALLVWLVAVPLAVLLGVLAYPRYAKWRVARAARRLERYASGPRPTGV